MNEVMGVVFRFFGIFDKNGKGVGEDAASFQLDEYVCTYKVRTQQSIFTDIPCQFSIFNCQAAILLCVWCSTSDKLSIDWVIIYGTLR